MRWRVSELLLVAVEEKGEGVDDGDEEEDELELEPPPKKPPKDIVRVLRLGYGRCG